MMVSCSSLICEDYQLVNQIALGPEVYWVKRLKDGGTKQTGPLAGVRLTYDRLKRYGWYLGADALYARGTLKGRSGADERIRSKLTDEYVEGRFGYTFQEKTGCNFLFTPFFGIGYFRETNNFCHPSHIPVHFQNSFSYVPFGFISHLYLSDRFGMGVKFTTRYLFKQHNKVTNDPDHSNMTLQYNAHFQYRLEIPMTYDCCFCNRQWRISLAPFFEYRRYGKMANFPFDFLDTKFRIYGANLQLVLLI